MDLAQECAYGSELQNELFNRIVRKHPATLNLDQSRLAVRKYFSEHTNPAEELLVDDIAYVESMVDSDIWPSDESNYLCLALFMHQDPETVREKIYAIEALSERRKEEEAKKYADFYFGKIIYFIDGIVMHLWQPSTFVTDTKILSLPVISAGCAFVIAHEREHRKQMHNGRDLASDIQKQKRWADMETALHEFEDFKNSSEYRINKNEFEANCAGYRAAITEYTGYLE